MTFEGRRRLAIPVSFCPFEQLSKVSRTPAATETAREQPLSANVPWDIQPDQGRCSWNSDFGEPPIHAFDDPTLCRGKVGNFLPSPVFVLLGSQTIVFPMDQIEIESWCVNHRADAFGKAAFARAAVANDECAQLQGFDHRSRVVACELCR